MISVNSNEQQLAKIFNVYAIKNEKDAIYIGQTSDLSKRLNRHNGLLKNKSTSFINKHKGEWTLIYKEEFAGRKEAAQREKQLKSYQGRKFIRNLISSNIRP